MIRILTVEDDAAISNLIYMTLTDARYDCTVATDGEEGLMLLENNTWDLVLLDLMLPKVSGYELLEIIRQETETPVIIISAMNDLHQIPSHRGHYGLEFFFTRTYIRNYLSHLNCIGCCGRAWIQ